MRQNVMHHPLDGFSQGASLEKDKERSASIRDTIERVADDLREPEVRGAADPHELRAKMGQDDYVAQMEREGRTHELPKAWHPNGKDRPVSVRDRLYQNLRAQSAPSAEDLKELQKPARAEPSFMDGLRELDRIPGIGNLKDEMGRLFADVKTGGRDKFTKDEVAKLGFDSKGRTKEDHDTWYRNLPRRLYEIALERRRGANG